jgi:hypothetical protein
MAITSDDNFLVQVATLQKAMLGDYQFYGPICNQANKMYDNFQEKPGQLGMTIQLKSPYQFQGQRTLDITDFGAIIDQPFPLTVSLPLSVPIAYDVEQAIYNLTAEQFMEDFGNNAAGEFGAMAEGNCADAIPDVTYRAYGDGITPVNSYDMLADAVEKFIDVGVSRNRIQGFLLNTSVPSIIAQGNNQFTLDRNNSTSASWELGKFSNAQWFKSNMLPVHDAGDVGVTQATVQVVSLTTTTTNGVSQTTLVLGGYTASVTDAIKENDIIIIGYNQGYRFVGRTGHRPTSQRFSVRATADADSDGDGEITIVVKPGIIWDTTDPLQNLNKAIDGAAISDGVDVTVIQSHRCGLISANKSFYSAMPALPNPRPYDGKTGYDKITGASCRFWGGQRGVGVNSIGWLLDGIQGVTGEINNNMRICYPLTQGS